jgi:hypothetical protein
MDAYLGGLLITLKPRNGWGPPAKDSGLAEESLPGRSLFQAAYQLLGPTWACGCLKPCKRNRIAYDEDIS